MNHLMAYHRVYSSLLNLIHYEMRVMVKESKISMKRNFFFILEYQKKLEQYGIKTKLVLIKNVIHSFFSLPGNIFNN